MSAAALQTHSLVLTPRVSDAFETEVSRRKSVENATAQGRRTDRGISHNQLFEGSEMEKMGYEDSMPSFVDRSEEVEEDRYAYTFKSPALTAGCRVVDVAMTIERVFDVDTVTQTFGVQVTVMMSWLMPDFEEPKPPEMDDGDWVPEWTPKYQFKNLMENIDMQESFFPYKDTEGVQRLMLEAQHVVRIYEQMELEKFPVDCQDLTLEIQMKQTTRDVMLQPMVEEGRPSFLLVKQNCFLNDFSLMEMPCVFGLYLNTPRLRKALDANRKGSYGKAVVGAQVKIERMVSFYVSNVMGVLFPIASFAISAWSLHPTDIEGRLAVDFQLILTAVAFKLVLNNMTPAVSYMTVLDMYVLGCFGFLSIVTAYHASFPYIYGVKTVDFSPLTLAPNSWGRGDEDELVNWDCGAMVVGIVGWMLFNLAYLWYFKSTQYKTNQDFMIRAKEEAYQSCRALHVITRRVRERDWGAASEIKGSRTFQEIKEEQGVDDAKATGILMSKMTTDVSKSLIQDDAHSQSLSTTKMTTPYVTPTKAASAQPANGAIFGSHVVNIEERFPSFRSPENPLKKRFDSTSVGELGGMADDAISAD